MFFNISELVRSENSPLAGSRWLSAFVASLISGTFVSVAIAPFDLISTRFYNQGVDSNGKGTRLNLKYLIETSLILLSNCFCAWKYFCFSSTRTPISFSTWLCQESLSKWRASCFLQRMVCKLFQNRATYTLIPNFLGSAQTLLPYIWN